MTFGTSWLAQSIILDTPVPFAAKGPLSSASDGFSGKSHLDLLSVGVNCVKLDAMLGKVDNLVGFT